MYTEIIDELYNIIQLSETDDLEYEFRLGNFYCDKFVADIKKEKFDKLLSIFNKSTSKGIFKKKEVNILDCMYNTIRKSIYLSEPIIFSKNNYSDIEFIPKYKNKILHISTMSKKKKVNTDFIIKNSPFDIRFSIAKEEPCSSINMTNPSFIRNKKRISYIYKENISYDFTIISQIDDINEQINYKYELELELLNVQRSGYNLKDRLLNAFIKVIDILKMCDEDTNKIYLIEKI